MASVNIETIKGDYNLMFLHPYFQLANAQLKQSITSEYEMYIQHVSLILNQLKLALFQLPHFDFFSEIQ